MYFRRHQQLHFIYRVLQSLHSVASNSFIELHCQLHEEIMDYLETFQWTHQDHVIHGLLNNKNP